MRINRKHINHSGEQMVLTGIVNSLVARTVVSLVGSLTKLGFNAFIGEALAERIKNRGNNIEDILKDNLSEISEEISWRGKTRFEEVCLFLNSAEVSNLIRQFLSVSILSSDNKATIEEEFLIMFSRFTDTSKDNLKEDSAVLWNYILHRIDLLLTKSINLNKLAAHEAKSNLRYTQLKGEIESIKKVVDLISNHKTPSIDEVHKYRDLLKRQIADRHSHIMPPYFDTAKKIHVDKLFVNPVFYDSAFDKDHLTYATQSFIKHAYRDVILGNPGGGKSTFVTKLCYDMCKQKNNLNYAERDLIPLLVILRDYGSEKKENKTSIFEHIISTIKTRYQIPTSSKMLEYLLATNRCLVIFDGLDELLDTSYRLEITADIESFCSLYPSIPILVTSREVGYEQAPLRKDIFDIYKLASFNEDQVREYVHKWFETDEDLTQDDCKKKINSFLRESTIVSDIRSNPLMLALMCNIYRGENYIPSNRPEVYEKCATMLFERWDKGRGIKVFTLIEQHIKPTMMYIAEWIYSNNELQGGVVEKRLIDKATEYLHKRRFSDVEEARQVATDFIEHCRGRMWVFTDMGTAKSGERLYQFTHRTFLEFFTAYNLVRNNPNPINLIEVLKPKIKNEEWDIVSQLAFQISNKNAEGACDILIEQTLNDIDHVSIAQAANLLYFSARSLSFIVPSPKIVEKLVKKCLSNTMNWLYQSKDTTSEAHKTFFDSKTRTREIDSILGSLVSTNVENLKNVSKSLEQELLICFEKTNTFEQEFALQIIYSVPSLISHRMNNTLNQNSSIEYWKAFSNRLKTTLLNKIIPLFGKYYWLDQHLFREGYLSFDKMINKYGVVFLTKSYQVDILSNTRYLSPIYSLFFSFEDRNYEKDDKASLDILKHLGCYFLENQDQVDFDFDFGVDFLFRHFESSGKTALRLEKEVLFGLLICFFIIFEMESNNNRSFSSENRMYSKMLKSNTSNSQNKLLKNLLRLAIIRFENKGEKNIDKILKEFGIKGQRASFIKNWALGNRSLTKRAN